MQLKPIAKIRNDFQTKFGIPRQSGLADSVLSRVVFEPEYCNEVALRGLSDFSHLWIVWGFSQVKMDKWQPTVRPPRLGGNKRMGVFATRSPFRPNPIGLSCVRIESVERGEIIVAGADMMDGTPVYDIKPYIPYTDCRPDAKAGFVDELTSESLTVVYADGVEQLVPKDKRKVLSEVLSLDPRPSYHEDEKRVYGLAFAGMDVHFVVSAGVLTVVSIS